MTAAGPASPPHPTDGARRVELEELLQMVREALRLRDEAPSGTWVEETASDLSLGTKLGFYIPVKDGGGLAFAARRGPSAYGHVHATAGAGGEERAFRLASILLESLPSDVASLDLGFTGLAPEGERTVAARLGQRPGSTLIERQEMEHRLSETDGRWEAEPPAPLERVPVRAVTVEALAHLDREAFEGTIDALLVGREAGEYQRVLGTLLAGRLGRFVDEASTAVVERGPARLVGAILTAERSSRHATFLDLMVDPRDRARGIGRFLLGWGLRALWALGYERVRLWVTLENRTALRLYDRSGFEKVGRATIYRWDRAGSAPQAHSPR